MIWCPLKTKKSFMMKISEKGMFIIIVVTRSKSLRNLNKLPKTWWGTQITQLLRRIRLTKKLLRQLQSLHNLTVMIILHHSSPGSHSLSQQGKTCSNSCNHKKKKMDKKREAAPRETFNSSSLLMYQHNNNLMMLFLGPREWILTAIKCLNRLYHEINKTQCLLLTLVRMVAVLHETNLKMKSRRRPSSRPCSVMKVTVRLDKVTLVSPVYGTIVSLLSVRSCLPRCARERNAGNLQTISCASTTIATSSRLNLLALEACPAQAVYVDTSKVSQSAISTSVHSHLKTV